MYGEEESKFASFTSSKFWMFRIFLGVTFSVVTMVRNVYDMA